MDLLSEILELLKLKGTFYFRTSFSPPWGVLVPAFENVSRFHFVHRGRCWLTVEGVEAPLLLEQGDLAIITHGAEHSMRDHPDKPLRTVDQVVSDAGFTGEGALVAGEQGSGQETQLACGHFAFHRDATHLLIEELPPYLHIKDFGESSTLWLESTLKLIGLEAGRANLGGDLIALKLTEIIFTQAIRAYLTAWRMQIARRNLVETDASIYQIAEQSGYRSEAAFGRVFKRHFNTAPATYRRLLRPEGQVA